MVLKAQCQATNLYQHVEDLNEMIQGDRLTWVQKQEYVSINHAITLAQIQAAVMPKI